MMFVMFVRLQHSPARPDTGRLSGRLSLHRGEVRSRRIHCLPQPHRRGRGRGADRVAEWRTHPRAAADRRAADCHQDVLSAGQFQPAVYRTGRPRSAVCHHRRRQCWESAPRNGQFTSSRVYFASRRNASVSEVRSSLGWVRYMLKNVRAFRVQ